MTMLYMYKAIVTKVYDGDSITVDIDLGMGVWVKGEKIRLAGINAPEVRGEEREEGLKSRDHLRMLIAGQEIWIKTEKDKKGKYGRYIATIYKDNGVTDINALMVYDGFAEKREY